MTLTKAHVNDRLDAIHAGGDIDVIRKGVELVLQALIDAEATEVIGAERYERADARTNWCNGNRYRLLAMKAGDVELKIPKLRRGQLLPVDPGTTSSHRPCPVRGGDGGVCPRRVDP